jgi:hypothetical protein
MYNFGNKYNSENEQRKSKVSYRANNVQVWIHTYMHAYIHIYTHINKPYFAQWAICNLNLFSLNCMGGPEKDRLFGFSWDRRLKPWTSQTSWGGGQPGC